MKEELHLILLGVVAGGSLYLFNLLPLETRIKQVANLLVLTIVVIWAIKWLIGHVE